MFYHLVCGGNVVIPVEEVKLAADNFGLNYREGIARVSTMILIAPQKLKNIELKFFCSRCERSVENIEEIMLYCAQCGKNCCLEDSYIIKGSGGIVCVNCKRKWIKKVRSCVLLWAKGSNRYEAGPMMARTRALS